MPSAASSTYRNSRVAEPGPPDLDCSSPSTQRVDALLDQRRDDVRRARVEVVVRAVEIDRQQMDGIQAVLLPVGLALNEEHLLGEPIGSVGLFGVAVPEVVLPERHRRELRVGADRSDGDEFSTPACRASSISWMPMIRLS